MRILWSSEHILCSDCGERSLVFPRFRKVATKPGHPGQPPRIEPNNALHS
jgi:hypothetical protein